MHIDANADGSLSWDEVSTFLLLGSVGHRKMHDDSESKEYIPVSTPCTQIQNGRHKDSIIKSVIDKKRDRMYTAGRDGAVRVWQTANLASLGTIHESAASLTDMFYCKKSNELTVAGVDRLYVKSSFFL